jgi:hypothetical protein
MKVLVYLGYIAFKMYEVLIWVANFIAAIAIIIISVYAVKMAVEGHKEMKIDRATRAKARAAAASVA